MLLHSMLYRYGAGSSFGGGPLKSSSSNGYLDKSGLYGGGAAGYGTAAGYGGDGGGGGGGGGDLSAGDLQQQIDSLSDAVCVS